MMYFIFIFLLPISNALVTVEILRNSLINFQPSCAFIREVPMSNETTIELCIQKCISEYNCQTAVYNKSTYTCSIFGKSCEDCSIVSSENTQASVICYRKNQDPLTTSSTNISMNQNNINEITTSDMIVTTTQNTEITTISTFQYVKITGINDTVVGIFNTTAGLSSDSYVGNSPPNENASNAFDGKTNTKYLNFGISLPTAGVNTGLYVTPHVGSSIAKRIQFATANDFPNRDPITITLEGSNNMSTELTLGSSWTLIYSGPTGISHSVNPGRLTYVPMQNFNNTIAYTSYRLLITSQRGDANSVQYSEANIYGIV